MPRHGASRKPLNSRRLKVPLRGNSALTPLANSGNAYNGLGDYVKALDYHQQALKLSTELGYRYYQSWDWDDLGIVYIGFRDYLKSVDCLKRAFEIAQADDIFDTRHFMGYSLAQVYLHVQQLKDALAIISVICEYD
jgi:tetratricopeptide (TPR) repeat protein